MPRCAGLLWAQVATCQVPTVCARVPWGLGTTTTAGTGVTVAAGGWGPATRASGSTANLCRSGSSVSRSALPNTGLLPGDRAVNDKKSGVLVLVTGVLWVSAEFLTNSSTARTDRQTFAPQNVNGAPVVQIRNYVSSAFNFV